MMPTLTYTELKELSPCSESFTRVAKLLGGARKWNGNHITAQQARDAGCTFDDILWAASSVAKRNEDVDRRLRLFLADCAAHVLPIYEKTEQSDAPRKAIIAARQFARGEITAAARAAALAAAWDAARDAARAAALAAAWDAAWDAARDAARAAALAAAWDAAWAAARDAARAAARAAALAAALAAAWDAALAAAWDAARDDEQNWQFDRLIAWLSDDEPEDFPLPEKETPNAHS